MDLRGCSTSLTRANGIYVLATVSFLSVGPLWWFLSTYACWVKTNPTKYYQKKFILVHIGWLKVFLFIMCIWLILHKSLIKVYIIVVPVGPLNEYCHSDSFPLSSFYFPNSSCKKDFWHTTLLLLCSMMLLPSNLLTFLFPWITWQLSPT